MSKLFALVGVLLILSGISTLLLSAQSEPITLPDTISGVVVKESDKSVIANAIVQVQATTNMTRTAEDGTFTLSGITGTAPLIVTAWTDMHYIGWVSLDEAAPDLLDGEGITITMKPVPGGDNTEYNWFTFEGVTGSASCGVCHREYEEWRLDQHAAAATNPHFLNIYTGDNIDGEKGQMTIWGEGGKVQPPDPNLPHYGPGFQLDNPGRAGNCATCHTPLASKSPNQQNCAWSGCHTSLTIERSNGIIDPHAVPLGLRGDAAEGITCDFCHKIGDVYIDHETGLPYPDMPGILSYRLYRPTEGNQVFFGTLPDVNRRDTYLPLLSESRYCAGCHFGIMGGVVGMQTVTGGTLVYNSYGEWLESPYSDPETGQTCQDCHMPVAEEKWFVFPEKGGLVRDYAELHNHRMPGATDEAFLQNTVTMDASAERAADGLAVEVNLTNSGAGHHVPTDAVTRSMILVVEAKDAQGNLLALIDGPVNPEFSGDLGGLPGKTFAKVLRDEWTGETPTAAIWRETTIVEDTRLPALATDTTQYVFEAPAGTEITVSVRLIFRRSFYALMQQKGWTDPDIMMEEMTLTIPTDAP